jgi:hypothetical protein
MAEVQPPAAPPTVSQEAKLRELNRQRRAATEAQAVEPVPADAGVLNVPFLGNRALDLANRGRISLERPQVAAATLDEAAKRTGRLEALRLGFSRVRSGRNAPERRASQGEGPRILNPALGFGTESRKERKKPEEQFSQLMVSGFIRSCWGCLWLTYGHSIYLIDILFLAQAGSKYLRRYIPGVGEEWIPPQILKVIPKTTLLPLKLGEIVGMCFVTFWVLVMDVILICLIAFLYAAIDAVAKNL